MKRVTGKRRYLAGLLLLLVCGCLGPRVGYHDPMMDFGLIKRVAVMPFTNLSREQMGGERVRDVFSTMLLATEAVYVVPPGEVARGVARAGIANPAQPSPEDVKKFAGVVEVDAVITGIVREYGEVRSGSTSANVVAVSLQMIDAASGTVIWSAAATKGGVTWKDRMFGGGGEPMSNTTQKAVNALLDQLFR